MLVANSNIWETRIQSVDALLTAARNGRTEVYYLATVCQVGIDPVLISISPNPEYPICDLIAGRGYFGLNFLAACQQELVARCTAVDRRVPDKLAAARLEHELSHRGTPLLHDCMQALECRVIEVKDAGDHRIFIGELTDRRIRGRWKGRQPHRFRGGHSPGRRMVKQFLCETRVYDLAMFVRRLILPPVSPEEGTRRAIRRRQAGA